MSVRFNSGRSAVVAKVAAVIVGVACMIAMSAVSASAVSVVSTLKQTWGTNGRVSAILADPSTNRVYVAGSFTAVTDSTGATTPIANVAAFLPDLGTFDTNWHPNPNGPVNALALSGGQLYLGGNFSQVAGQSRNGLAGVTSTGTALQWAPGVSGGVVSALAVNGGSIFVGGNFTSLAGVSRSYLGRVSLSSGSLDSSWTPNVSARVRSLVVSGDGARVYAGGDFMTINGSTVGKSIASLTTSTPATLTTGFNAGATSSGLEPPAMALYLDGGNLLAAVAGSGGGCASLSASTGKTQWSKHANGNMQAVTAMDGTVYCGGHFSGSGSFDGQTRFKLAAVDEGSGNLLGFAPRINSALGVWALDHDSRLYVGGDFTKVSGKAQPHFAVFN